MAGGWRIGREDPRDPSLALLHARHGAAMAADTPPESNHRLSAEELHAGSILFYVVRAADGAAAAMGALKPIEPGHTEIKSMHVLTEYRGQGLARLLLAHLLAEARAHGFHRVSLETGRQPGFAAARALYQVAGFAECPPFTGYRPDPLSIFMTLALPAAA